MDALVGTSGFSYPEWKGSFYPEDLAADAMLDYYATRLPAVEINNTFYRMPKSAVVQSWAEAVPDTFRFVIKASRRITHQAKLVDTEDTLAFLWRAVDHLGDKLGAILFQLPKWDRRDDDRLAGFLAAVPTRYPIVFDFAHRSWNESSDVAERLAAHHGSVCVTDGDGEAVPTLPAAGTFGYLRLRAAHYADDALAAWVDAIRATDWDRVFVFFKHEDDGAGPRLARRFLDRWERTA